MIFVQILDTCAAPGSKTVQMLEMLHEGAGLPSGFVVANDSETQRCNLLVHHTKRMHSPALVVTNHDASAFPLLKRHNDPKVPPPPPPTAPVPRPPNLVWKGTAGKDVCSASSLAPTAKSAGSCLQV